MSESFNIYLDESCHLQNDGIPTMCLGAIWCEQDKARLISVRIREIKEKYQLSPTLEIKWTKVSPARLSFYLELVDYFFDDDDLHFRGVIIPDKTQLNHQRFQQNHDDWYYKMCFTLLEPIIDPTQHYAVYLDIKDTQSERKRQKLEEVLRNAKYDGAGDIIRRIQQIRSHESEILQLTDLLLGAVTYVNRELISSPAKLALIDRVKTRSKFSLRRTTWLREPKFNLLLWHPQR